MVSGEFRFSGLKDTAFWLCHVRKIGLISDIIVQTTAPGKNVSLKQQVLIQTKQKWKVFGLTLDLHSIGVIFEKS